MATVRDARGANAWIFFSWWQSLNSWLARMPTTRQCLIFAVAAAAAFGARLWAQGFPYNYDFTAYVAVSDQILAGGNPYETGKHNYGPIWFLIHGTIRRFLEDPATFRVGLAVLFAVTDVVIAWFLMRRGYLAGAVLFLLAPITIAISGQHGQFDNIAIALALGASILMRREGRGARIGWVDGASVLALGLSLSTKHDFLILPVWFALMQSSWPRRLFYGLMPYVIFGLTLAPYWLLDSTPVREYVLNYRSNTNAPAYYFLFPDEIVWGWVNRGYVVYIFLAVLVVLGWWYRRMPAFEATLAYAVSLVVFSVAIVDQYFAIPMAGIAVFLNIGFLVWIGYISIYLLGEPEDFNLPGFSTLKLHLAPYQEGTYHDQLIYLFVGWIIMNVWLWKGGWISGHQRDASSTRAEAPNTSG